MTRESTRYWRFLPSTFAALCFLVLATTSSLAEDQVASFLAIPVDVPSAGAGGADVARPAYGISPFGNPAGAVSKTGTAVLTHGRWLAGQSVNALMVRLPLSQGKGGLALTGRMVEHASIPRFDAGGDRVASLEPSDLSVGLLYALRFGRFSFGAGANYVQENLDLAKGSGFAYDFGMLVDVGALRLGAAANNALGSLDYDGQSYEIPTRFAVGATYAALRPGVELAAQYNSNQFYGEDVSLGIHWMAIRETLVLRAGYVAMSDAAATDSFAPYRVGFTVAHRWLALDYAYVPHEQLGQAHLFALRWTGR